jgi:hypothetical protein
MANKKYPSLKTRRYSRKVGESGNEKVGQGWALKRLTNLRNSAIYGTQKQRKPG